MPPKKAQKMSLNEFLGDSALGSWADEMDALPTAPSGRPDDGSRPGGRRGDDFLSSRPDRGPVQHREDLPLPTEPPYTAYVGNLAFDLVDMDIEEFFAGIEIKSIKIIKDREEKPKGFGYVEFAELDGLKAALELSGSSLVNRTVRISVAEPPKSGFGGGGGFDDEKFAGPWRRDGPLPDRDGPRRRADGPPGREPPPPAVSDNISDWRSSKPRSAPPPEADGPSFKRRGSGFGSREGVAPGAADSEENWTMGSKFKPSGPSEGGAPGSRFGSLRGRGDMGPPRESTPAADEGEWRRAAPLSRNSTSPNSSVPPTPQMGRRKLELLPRSGASNTPSPLSSPNPANTTHKPNPFGAAKPVDTLSKEAAVAERLEKDHERVKERVSHPMSRTSSKAASTREPSVRTPPAPSSPKADSPKPAAVHANVRPAFSFASAAAGKKDAPADGESNGDVKDITNEVEKLEVS